MYGLPVGFDASVFVGRKLDQLSFSENTLHLIFDSEISITVLSSISFQKGGASAEQRFEVPIGSTDLMMLLGRVVQRASAERSGRLILEFDGAYALTFEDDSDAYESYHIQIGDKRTIV